MIIQPYIASYNTYHPNFNSNERVVRNKVGEILYRNTTNFFRSDLDWETLINHINEKYKNIDKVNIVCHACSDGSEPLSIAMLLEERLGEKAEKFFPIQAKDIDDIMIYTAKQGYAPMDLNDVEAINAMTNNKCDKYFKLPRYGVGLDTVNALINPKLTSKIEYSVADITNDIENLPQENIILFCRNMWPYIYDPGNLILKIANHIKSNGTIVVGNYDKMSCIHNLLPRLGFKNIHTNIYEK